MTPFPPPPDRSRAERPTSKPLRKAESSAARLSQRVLEGGNVYCTDVDLLFRTAEGWIVVEYLKCDSARVTPATSHPARYWYNWRKFRKLWDLASALHGRLVLINYEEAGLNGGGRFRIMEADMHVQPDERTTIRTTDIEADCDFARFQAWFLDLNERSRLDLGSARQAVNPRPGIRDREGSVHHGARPSPPA